MPEVQESKRSTTLLILRRSVYALLILIMIYALSFGPVVAFVENSPEEVRNDYFIMYHEFYYPLLWVISKSPFIMGLFYYYLEFWRSIF